MKWIPHGNKSFDLRANFFILLHHDSRGFEMEQTASGYIKNASKWIQAESDGFQMDAKGIGIDPKWYQEFSNGCKVLRSGSELCHLDPKWFQDTLDGRKMLRNRSKMVPRDFKCMPHASK